MPAEASRRRAAFAASAELEAARVRFLEHSRGREAAVAFARQTRSGYRRVVLARSAPAGDADYRLRLTASYCYLKRYLLGAA